MNRDITLVYDADCPNVTEARVALREALQRAGLEPQWIEYDRAAPGTPVPLLRFGSPTILVDGIDVAARRDAPPPRPVGFIRASADFAEFLRLRPSLARSCIAQ
jgi:hypothetical protein